MGQKRPADFVRPLGVSDHDFVRLILKQAAAAFEAKGADYARLMAAVSWVYDETLGVYVKPKGKSLN